MTDTELTRLAAEKVMGWTVHPTLKGRRGLGCWNNTSDGHAGCIGEWQPLTDWRAAGEIVEKMRADGWYLQTDTGPKSRARATFHLGNAVHTARDAGGNILRAIRNAALLAVQAVTGEQV